MWDRDKAASALGSAFWAFLSRFPRLTTIQAEAMPKIFAGEGVVVIAPSASGKTEAALAPLCRRLELSGKGGMILYVVPTRALANDLEVRAKGPCDTLGLRLVVRTGDRPKALRGKEPPEILVTTPESLDSLLCRWPEGFSNLFALVIDEAHLLYQTPRGDHMGILVRRLLRWHTKERPQMLALSATIGDPEGLSLRLFGERLTVVRAGTFRPITVIFANKLAEGLFNVRSSGLSKVLVFCNTRKDVEKTAAYIRNLQMWLPERVACHHASLSRREREDVEAAFRWWKDGVIVCTPTLEVGVDIGDVDAVVLFGAPENVEAFYQRVGRGCRRKSGMLAVCVPLNDMDRHKFMLLVEQIRNGTFVREQWRPDLGVAVQQVFSILFGKTTGVSIREIVDILAPIAPEPVLREIIQHLMEADFVTYGFGDRIMATTKLMDMGEKGKIHSNIEDAAEIEVRDEDSGKLLGTVSSSCGTGDTIALAGKQWTIVRQSGKTLFARPTSVGVLPDKLFGAKTSRSPFGRYLPHSLQ